ncbi:uncharacterized protein [Typha latifolia]|uniref:uncharacterized protein n=1 Tax=Typha latifolia TaxID=4733 RepID=UPI003C2B56A4
MARELACCLLALALALSVSLIGLAPVCAADDCSDDINGLLKQCKEFVIIPGPKTPPSTECCDVVQRVNIPCVCEYVSKEIEKIISMDKVVFVAEYCKRPLAHGSKCGSYTVPMARG